MLIGSGSRLRFSKDITTLRVLSRYNLAGTQSSIVATFAKKIGELKAVNVKPLNSFFPNSQVCRPYSVVVNIGVVLSPSLVTICSADDV